jgi:hypothetical protein
MTDFGGVRFVFSLEHCASPSKSYLKHYECDRDGTFELTTTEPRVNPSMQK